MTIKNLSKLLALLFACILLFSLTACGGGGGGGGEGAVPPTQQAQKAQQVTVTFGLNGGSATTVGAVDLDVVLPDGFVLAVDSSTGLPTDTALALLVSGAYLEANYIPETTAANGAIDAGIMKGDGFAGNSNLIQLTHTFAAGVTLPTANDFMVTVVASDLNGVPLTAINGQISITTQPVP